MRCKLIKCQESYCLGHFLLADQKEKLIGLVHNLHLIPSEYRLTWQVVHVVASETSGNGKPDGHINNNEQHST